LLERPTQPEQPSESDEPETSLEAIDPEPEPAKGRGAGPRKAKPAADRPAKVKGRTIYLHDDLFERIIVQAHRRNRTISEYVSAILERQVPDHRVIRNEPGENGAA
jgi:hypothetical protein